MVPVKYYVANFLALIVLTIFTVTVSRYNFGEWNIFIAMTVAVIKASLVLLFFMGLKWEKPFIRLAFIFTIIFMGIFMAFTLADISTRGSVNPSQEGVHDIHSPVRPMSNHDASETHH